MIWDKDTCGFVPQNAILLRQLHRQVQTTTQVRRFIETFGVVALAMALSVAMLVSVMEGVSKRYDWREIGISVEGLAWIFRGVVIVRLLASGVSSALSHPRIPLPDEFKVSPIDIRQFLSAKWWVALHQVRGWILALCIVQLGVVASFSFVQLTQIDWGMTCGNPCEVTIRGLASPSLISSGRLLFVVGAAIGLAVLEAICCTALGMFSSLLVQNRFSLFTAISLRFAPIFLFAYFPDFSWESPFGRYHSHTWFSLADGGTGAIIQLVYPINIWADALTRGILGLGLVSAMLAVITSLSITALWIAMRRRQQ